MRQVQSNLAGRRVIAICLPIHFGMGLRQTIRVQPEKHCSTTTAKCLSGGMTTRFLRMSWNNARRVSDDCWAIWGMTLDQAPIFMRQRTNKKSSLLSLPSRSVKTLRAGPHRDDDTDLNVKAATSTRNLSNTMPTENEMM